MNKPVISFKNYEILNLEYKKIEDEIVEKTEISPKVAIGVTEELDLGKVEIDVTIVDSINNRTIRALVRGIFSIQENLSLEEIELYLTQNGTAILYPYTRSIISMISSLDSESSILLPTINTLNE